MLWHFNQGINQILKATMDPKQKAIIEQQAVDALRKVYDPEIPVNVYDLGLIYDIVINDDGQIQIVMTLTNPNCPVADTMPLEVRNAVMQVEGVNHVAVEMVFEPEWSKEMMSEAAMLELGLL
jgi:FeS assembly SUF system protein